jgi:anti-anti-sigma regulatory factor
VPDGKHGDQSDNRQKAPEAQVIKSADAQEARQASGSDLAAAQSTRTNASDGSLRKYSGIEIAAQEHSIELISGERVASRTSELTEKDFKKPDKVQSKLKDAILKQSQTGHDLITHATHNPVLEPVAQLRKFADSLEPGEQKDALIKLSREQAAELSPEMSERFRKIAERRELIDQSGLDRAGSFNLSALKSQTDQSPRHGENKATSQAQEAVAALQNGSRLDSYGRNDLLAQAGNTSEVVTDATDASEKAPLLERWRDGEPLNLKEFFDLPAGASPIIDAYRASKALNDGNPGKSPTLEHTLDRLQNCPWSDEINIVRDNGKAEKDYDSNTKTIEIGGDLSSPRQIETFAHEAFHATHRDYFKLYLHPDLSQKPGGTATLDDYRNTRFGAEVKAFETEIKINQELTGHMPDGRPVTMAVMRKGPVMGVHIPSVWEKDTIERPDLCALYARDGLSGLWRFLRDERPVKLDSAGRATHSSDEGYLTETPYGQRYDGQYESWHKPNFSQQQTEANEMLQKFLAQGHTLAEFEEWGY